MLVKFDSKNGFIYADIKEIKAILPKGWTNEGYEDIRTYSLMFKDGTETTILSPEKMLDDLIKPRFEIKGINEPKIKYYNDF